MAKYNPQAPSVIAEFDRLCTLEPRLRELYDEISQVKDDPTKPSFCANTLWHGTPKQKGFKSRMLRLVGYGAGQPEADPPQSDPGDEDNPFRRGLIVASDLGPAPTPPPDFPVDLTTSQSYDIAFAVLYNRLPDCRNCSC